MFRYIAYFPIFGWPLIVYLGILTFLSFLTTAIVGFSIYKGWLRVPIKTHLILAITSLTLATIHGFLGIMSHF
jgi:hypothetical protein